MAEATMSETDETVTGQGGDEGFYDSANDTGTSETTGGEEKPEAAKPRLTLAQMAAEAPDAEGSGTEPEPEAQSQLFGTERKVTASVKGPKPKSSHVVFSTAEAEVSGQFGGEDLIELRVLCELSAVEIRHRRKAGAIVDTRRIHKAKAISVNQINVSPELIMARAQHVADALGVDVHELIAAQDAAITEVSLPE